MLTITPDERRGRALMMFLSLSVLSSWSWAVELPELRQYVQDSQKQVRTFRTEFTVETFMETPPALLAVDPCLVRIDRQVLAINEHRREKITCIADVLNRREKAAQRDLRDIDALVKERQLTAVQHASLGRDSEHVIHNRRQLRLRHAISDVSPTQLVLSEAPVRLEMVSDLLDIGTVSLRDLDGDYHAVVREESFQGNSAVRVSLSKNGDNVQQEVVYICDPSIGYRYTSKQVLRNGQLRSEVIAGDYRNVDGVPFPFEFTIRRFGSDGHLTKELKYTFEDVQFNVEVSDEDFQLEVPPDTLFINAMLGGKVRRIEDGGKFGIADALTYDAMASAMAEAEEYVSQLQLPRDEMEEVLIPDARRAQNQGAEYHIYDLRSGTFVTPPTRIPLHSEEMLSRLKSLEKGDIAWDGHLVMVRGATAWIRKQDEGEIAAVSATEWDSSVELREDCELPLMLLVVTEDEVRLCVTIKEITSEGLVIVPSSTEAQAEGDYESSLRSSRTH